MRHADSGGSSIQQTHLLNLDFSTGTTDMWLRNGDSLPNAKPFSVLPWLETVIIQNAEQQLALCWHSFHIQQLIQEVGQMMYNTFYCLGKCICYRQRWKSIRLLCELVKAKKVYRFHLAQMETVLYNRILALQIYTTYAL